MSFDFSNALGGAASGAAAGAALGTAVPVIGNVIGGIAGGLIGAIGGGTANSDKPQYTDPYASQEQGQIANELQSNVGAQEATATAGALRANANTAYRGISNNPNFSGNASVLSSAYNQTQKTAQSGIVNANIAGASLDQQTRHQGVEDAMSASRNALSGFQTNAGISMTPSPLGQVGINALGSLAGSFFGKVAHGTSGNAGDSSEVMNALSSRGYQQPQTQSFDANSAYRSFVGGQ